MKKGSGGSALPPPLSEIVVLPEAALSVDLSCYDTQRLLAFTQNLQDKLEAMSDPDSDKFKSGYALLWHVSEELSRRGVAPVCQGLRGGQGTSKANPFYAAMKRDERLFDLCWLWLNCRRELKCEVRRWEERFFNRPAFDLSTAEHLGGVLRRSGKKLSAATMVRKLGMSPMHQMAMRSLLEPELRGRRRRANEKARKLVDATRHTPQLRGKVELLEERERRALAGLIARAVAVPPHRAYSMLFGEEVDRRRLHQSLRKLGV